MDMEKEMIRELNHRQKVIFRTLLLPVLVAWEHSRAATLTIRRFLGEIPDLNYPQRLKKTYHKSKCM